MKKLLFPLILLIVLGILSAAVLAAGEIGIYIDFEKYETGFIAKDTLYKTDDLWVEADNLYIEGNDDNKYLRVAHYNNSGQETANTVSKYGLNLDAETIFKFDIQNRKSATGYVYVQLRSDDGTSPETGRNLFYPLLIKDNVITYLDSFGSAKYSESIADNETARIVMLLNPGNGEISIWNNGVLKAHAEPSDIFKDFTFAKTILRFQNYVKKTPSGSSPYVTDIVYDNMTFIKGGSDLVCTSSDLYFGKNDVIDEAKDGPLTAAASVINKSGSKKNLRLFITHKSDGELKGLGFDDASIGYGEVANLKAEINVSLLKPTDYMELILLDMDTMSPVIAPKIVYLNNFIKTPVASEMLYKYNSIKAPHPRIVSVSADFKRILNLVKTDTIAGDWSAQIIAEADKIVAADIDDSTKSNYYLAYSSSMLGTSRNALSMLQYLGVAHKLSGHPDSKYSDKAAEILETVCAYPDWHPGHFLDTAEMMTAVSFGYDWFYDSLSSSAKLNIERAVYEKGLLVAKSAYEGTGGSSNSGWWKDVDYNWNIVCNGAIAVTAAAFADIYPDLSSELSAKAVNYVKYALKPFAPHGGAEEGCVYGIYTLRYLSKLETTLKNTYGTDFGMMKHSGLSGLGNYLISVDGSTGINSYHDTNGGGTHIDTATLMWLGNIYNNPKFNAARMNAIENHGYNVTPFDLLWYNPDVTSADFTNLPLDSYFAGTELVAMRSGYGNEDIYLSAHGGKANVSHSHIDGGTFILDMLGIRVAADIGADSYDADGYFGDKRYEYYRTRAEGHNTIVINPDTTPGQSTNCNLVFERTGFSDSKPFAILDMTDAYKPYNCTSAKRGYMLSDNRQSAVIRDELTLSGTNTVYWFMQTAADVQISGNTATFTSGGKTVKAEFLTNSANAVLSVDKASPLPESNSTVTNWPNTSYKRLQLKFTGSGNVNITVKFTPLTGSFTDVSSYKSLSEWN